MTLRNAILGLSLILLCVLPLSQALAGQLSAIINGKSYHFNSSYDWNEDNLGLGIEHEFDSDSAWRTSVMANAFNDSTDNMSYMVGGGLQRRLFTTERLSGFYVNAGLTAFLMTRDDVNGGKPFPGILPSVTVGNDKYGLNFTYLPKAAVESTTNSRMVDPTISGILFVQFKIRLDALSR